MSCDFAIVSLPKPLTDAEAMKLYAALCESDVSGVTGNPAIDAFYAELTATHPEIDDVPEDKVDDFDLCPWSIAFDRSPGHLIICCVWKKAGYVQRLLTDLTRRHGLALIDPQQQTISYPGKRSW